MARQLLRLFEKINAFNMGHCGTPGGNVVIEFLVLAGIAVGVVYHFWRKKEEKDLPGRQHP